MNSKERVKMAVSHSVPDRTPKDYWAVPETTERLINFFAVNNKEELLDKLGIDCRYIKPDYTGEVFSEEKDESLQQKLPDGNYKDIWGIIRKRVEWGRGSYLEVISSPFSEIETVKDIENYSWSDPEVFDYKGMKEKCSKKYRDKAVIFTGDRLTTRASVFKLALYLRGFENFFIDLATNEKLVCAIVEKLLKFHLIYAQKTFESAGDIIDIFMLGDDFGTETGPLISPGYFRKFFKNPLKQLIELGHKYDVKVMLHSCGGIKEFIPDFIEIGLDILNPVQPGAAGMAPDELKKEFGKDLCFHGAIDVQKVLPFGSPDEVREEVKEKIAILGKKGGFILAPSHNLQPDVSPENIAAMYENT